ncbi:MAG: hypothetical protein B6244_11130 [Candidatus Cloacimonetes bacterium 4572_55]|nr:MAG: hypothetical protein B6244_11130 [Candidatus Cloacimonetes bacterium 4572_55]
MRIKKYYICLSALAILFSVVNVYGFDDYQHYTTVGNIGVTVTNFGLVGNGFDQDQPACEYPLGTKTELMARGGLWIGALKDGDPRVSTGVIDGAFSAGQAGFEFAPLPEEGLIERSTIQTSPFFALDAVSQQDFVSSFYDTFTVIPGTNEEIPDHTPLEIRVDMESYAWSFSYADAYVILNYRITNIGNTSLDSVYVGFWQNTAVGNLIFSDYFGDYAWDWYDDMNNYLPEESMCYEYDAESDRYENLSAGDLGYSQSYFGFRFLGSSQQNVRQNYNMWIWNRPADQDYPMYSMPTDDRQRYEKMQSSLSPDLWETPVPHSWMMLSSIGTFPTIEPGESIDVTFAIVGGLWANQEERDSPERRENLIVNSQWAQKVYNGEDNNGNGVLDAGEDLDDDGEIDRFFGPEPPPSPNLEVVSENGKVTLYWNNYPETVEDRISRTKDFEGYRIYRVQSETGQVGMSNDVSGEVDGFTLLAQFDKINDIGYNIGLGDIYSPTVVDGDSMHYRFTDEGVLNGWPYYYAVTAYDRGDPETNLAALASSVNLNKTLIYPGEVGSEIEDDSVDDVGVYPNPYRTEAQWDGGKERERLIWFTNLPTKCTIRIYTLAGELVDNIQHDASTYYGEDINLLDRIGRGEARFSGGEHAWDLISEKDQAIATGMYLYTVESDGGNLKRGKFLVIK